MSTRQAAMRRTRGTAVLVVSILLIVGLIAWIAIARGGASGKDFEGTGNGEEQVVEIPEGSNLSAGERQLVTIARAFLTDPALLILDEATSSVDTRTEVLIQEAMSALRSDRTSFVIAHRLSTVETADRVLVMHDGRIVEDGSPADTSAFVDAVLTDGTWRLRDADPRAWSTTYRAAILGAAPEAVCTIWEDRKSVV